MLYLLALVWALMPSLKLPEVFVAAAPTVGVGWGPEGYSAEGYGFRVEAQRMKEDTGRLGTGTAISFGKFTGHPGTGPGLITPGAQTLHGFIIRDSPGSEGQWTNVNAHLDIWMLEWNWRRRLFSEGPARGTYVMYGVGSGRWRETLRATFRYAGSTGGSFERNVSDDGDLEAYLGGLGIARRISGRFWLDGAVRYQSVWQPRLWSRLIPVPNEPMHTVTLAISVRYAFPATVKGKQAEP